jgi:hypothetical protein
MRFFESFLQVVRPPRAVAGQPLVGRSAVHVRKTRQAHLSVVGSRHDMGGLRRRVHAHLVHAGFEIARTEISTTAEAASAVACFTVRFCAQHQPDLLQSAQQLRSDRAVHEVALDPPQRPAAAFAVKA